MTCAAPPALHAPTLHDRAPLAHARAPHTHARHTPSPATHRARPRKGTPCSAPQFSSSEPGEKHAQNKPRRAKHAQNLQALSHSLTEVSRAPPARLYTSTFPGALPSRSSHRMWSAPQVVRPRVIKWLAAFCVLECISAATSPSSPAPKFGAAMIDGGEGSGSGEGSPPSTCGCSGELEAMAVELEGMAAELEGVAVLHAAELEGVRGEFEVKLEGVRGEFEVKFEGIHQFLSMTPPSSPPSPPPPPSSPQVRDCAAGPCTDGYWQTKNGIGCAALRTYYSGGAPSFADAEERLAGDSCCQFCPPPSPPPSPSSPPSPCPPPPSPSPPPPS
eukprot:scaffold106372_cov69-Phaeocystis_antarctica.AAC.2